MQGERFIAISTWEAGSPAASSIGSEMTGLDDVEAAPMLGPTAGRSPRAAGFDSESIALDGPLVYIGLERVNQVLVSISARVYPLARRGVRCRRRRASCLTTRGWKRWSWCPRALALAGTLIAISERGLDHDGNLIAFLIEVLRPGSSAFAAPTISTSATAVLLPSGDLLVLERRFRGSQASASDPAHRAQIGGARRRGRWALDLRCRSGPRDRHMEGSTPMSLTRATPC